MKNKKVLKISIIILLCLILIIILSLVLFMNLTKNSSDNETKIKITSRVNNEIRNITNEIENTLVENEIVNEVENETNNLIDNTVEIEEEDNNKVNTTNTTNNNTNTHNYTLDNVTYTYTLGKEVVDNLNIDDYKDKVLAFSVVEYITPPITYVVRLDFSTGLLQAKEIRANSYAGATGSDVYEGSITLSESEMNTILEIVSKIDNFNNLFNYKIYYGINSDGGDTTYLIGLSNALCNMALGDEVMTSKQEKIQEAQEEAQENSEDVSLAISEAEEDFDEYYKEKDTNNDDIVTRKEWGEYALKSVLSSILSNKQ